MTGRVTESFIVKEAEFTKPLDKYEITHAKNLPPPFLQPLFSFVKKWPN